MAAKRDSVAKLNARVAELETALERSLGVNKAFRRVGMAVGMTVDLDELLELILDTTRDILRAERGTLFLRRDDVLVSRVKQGDDLQTIEIAVGVGIAGHVAKTGRSLRVADAYKDARFDPSWDKKSGYRTRSILTAPIKGGDGNTIGVLQVLNKRDKNGAATVFSKHDAEVLTALATQAAVSIEKSDLFLRLLNKAELLEDMKEDLERSVQDLETLYNLETAMSRAHTLPELAREVIAQTAETCGAAAGALLFESLTAELRLYMVNLAQPEQVREVLIQPGEGIAGRAMESHRLITMEDPRHIDDPSRVRELLGVDVRSAIAAPLVIDGRRVCGALALYNKEKKPSRFSEGDGRLLRLVSANVSTALRLLEAREEKERGERLTSIGSLLSGVMHDLRTPLTVVSGYVQLMQVTDDAPLRAEYGATVAEQFEIISAMQRDLLAYARGAKDVLMRKIYLAKFCEDLAKQFRFDLQELNVPFNLVVEDTGTAVFDENKIARALGNLIRNGIESMTGKKGDSLTFRCTREGDDLVFEVSDTGRGIPKAIRSRVFEPFVTAGKKTGTGLGLANVKKIIDQHDGQIDVRSSRKGTCFTVRLPQAQHPHSRRTPT